MFLNQIVKVYCTDTEKSSNARIVRIHPRGIDVELNNVILKFNKTKPDLYVCNYSGMEFVIKK